MLVLGGVSHMVMELAKARGAEVVTTASAAKHSQSHVIESRYVTLLNIMFGPTCTSLIVLAELLRSHLIFKGTQVAAYRKYGAERDGAPRATRVGSMGHRPLSYRAQRSEQR